MIPLHGSIETFNFVAGIILNAYLLYLIRRFSSKALGAYKHLLTLFAAQDIFLSIVEAIFNVTPVRVGTIIGVVGRTFWESRPGESFALLQQAVSIGALRVCLDNPLGMNNIHRHLTFIFVCGGDVDDPATIVLRNSYQAEFNVSIYDGWVTLEYWPNDHLSSSALYVLVFTDTILISSSLTSMALCALTFYHIHVNTTVSASSRKLQRWMLIALCAQASVPFLCVYFPYVSNLNTPFFGVANLVPQEVSVSFVSAFPLWDAAVIILMMKDYRVGALSIIVGDRKNRKKHTISKMFTTAIEPTTTVQK